MWCDVGQDQLCVRVVLISSHSEFLHAFSFVPCCCSLASFPSSFAAAGSSSSASFSTMSFSLSRPYPIFSIILLYNKEAVSCTLCSLSTSASRVAVTGADAALYNFEIVFLKIVLIFYYTFLRNFLISLWTR